MVGPINPKTFIPRSLEVSRQEQIEKARPEIQYQQTAQDLAKKSQQKQQKVNQTEKTESKQVEEEESNNSRQENQDHKEDDQENKQQSSQNCCGNHIDIRV
ncbi:hypothetical protein JCM16358_07500 [Halanaerocella petrolearia]